MHSYVLNCAFLDNSAALRTAFKIVPSTPSYLPAHAAHHRAPACGVG
jgi:hypothetical protein